MLKKKGSRRVRASARDLHDRYGSDCLPVSDNDKDPMTQFDPKEMTVIV